MTPWPFCFAMVRLADFYALRASHPEFVIGLSKLRFSCGASLLLLPNLAFSTALAHRTIASAASGDDESKADAADDAATASTPAVAQRALVEALLAFPTVLPALLEKCEVDIESTAPGDSRPWKHYLSDPLFRRSGSSSLLDRLVSIFTTRHKDLWTEPSVSTAMPAAHADAVR